MAKKTTQTPNPSPGARSRRSALRPPDPAAAMSPPFSPAPLRARLGAASDVAIDTAAASSSTVEHPCVTLWEWWLERVEREERKIAVSGFTERNDAFTSAPIAKRHEPLTLQDEDGVVVLLYGSMLLPRMRQNGFSMQICERFMIGFPYWWESWDSHMGSHPSYFIDPREGSAQFYLEKFQLGNFLKKIGPSFIENILNDAQNFPIDDLNAFKDSSRFEEYTCGNDISRKENSDASDDARPAAVANMEIGLTASSTSQERDHVDIDYNASLAPTETYTGYETSKEAGNQNDTMHADAREDDAGSHLFNSDWICTMSPNHVPIDLEGGNATDAENSMDLVSKYPLAIVPPESVEPLSYQSTPVAPLKSQHHLERIDEITLNEEAVPNEDTPSSVHSDVQYLEKTVGSAEKGRSANKVFGGPTRSPMTRSSVPYVHQCRLTRSRAQSLSISTPESLKMKRTKSGRVVVPQLDSGSKRIVYDNDGLISGVAPVVLQLPLKGSKLARPAKKRSRAL